MTRLLSLSTSLLLSMCAVGLVGCASDVVFPDPGAPLPAAVPMGGFRGSDFGGHAPIVNARIFVLQAGTGGYGGKAVSLLDPPYAASPAPYPTQVDNTTDATAGMSYVTTDAKGLFNITGDYTCTPGLPVYLYGAGGTSELSAGNELTGYTVTGNSIQFTAYNLVSVGQYVSFANLPGPLSGLNSGTYLVTQATPENDLTNATGTFTITATGYGGSGSLASNALAFTVGNDNPAIVNLLLMGVCPTTGAKNFSSLTFLYMNEVSTVATAYGLGSFFSSSATQLASTDAVHLAIPQENGPGSPAWVGLEDAAATTAEIYNIEGTGTISTSGNGEGHIANVLTPNGGTVSQSLVDAIANALAGCVDSGNTATTPSPACTTLQTDASSTSGAGGVPSGQGPPDTATVAIDLAHNPWNLNATAILNQAGVAPPYAPAAAQANDLAVTIAYPMTGAQSGTKGGVAIDSANNVWATGWNANALTKMTPTGQVLFQTTSLPSQPGMVALDSHDNAWVALRGPASLPNNGTASGAYEFTSAGVLVAGSPFQAGTFSATLPNQNYGLENNIWVAVDASDNAYFTQHPFNNVLELNAAGAVANSWSQGLNVAQNIIGWSGPVTDAVDYKGNVYATVLPTQGTAHAVEVWTPGVIATPSTLLQTIADPFGIALDAAGNAWITDAGSTSLWELPSGGAAVTQYASSPTLGGVNAAVGVAVDPAGMVFVSSPGTVGCTPACGALSAFASQNSGGAVYLTGGSGLNGSVDNNATTPVSNPYFIAVDESGNLWANTATTLVKFMGFATPVLTPVSANLVQGQTTHVNMQRP